MNPSSGFPVFDTTGYLRLKNNKFNFYIGRSPIEDKSNEPKNFFPLRADEVGRNGLFHYTLRLDKYQWEFKSLGSVVTKADNPTIPSDAQVIRPVALVGSYAMSFKWKIGDKQDTMYVVHA